MAFWDNFDHNDWEQGILSVAAIVGGAVLIGTGAGALAGAALVAGGVSGLAGVADRNQEETEIRDQKDAAKAAADAAAEVNDANWGGKLEEARRAWDQMGREFDTQAAGALTAFGEQGTAWHQLTNKVLADKENEGAYSAQAGMSGFANSGSVTEIGNVLSARQAADTASARREIAGQQTQLITGLNEMQRQRSLLNEDWEGFDFNAFKAGDSYLAKQYQAGVASQDAAWGFDALRYDQALGKVSGWQSWLRFGGDLFGGGKQGLGIGSTLGLPV